jgi:hypothetical protein
MTDRLTKDQFIDAMTDRYMERCKWRSREEARGVAEEHFILHLEYFGPCVKATKETAHEWADIDINQWRRDEL